MKRFITLLITSFLALTAFAQKDPFVGFYKGEVVAPKYGYPMNTDHTVYGEVFKGPEGYRVRFQPAIMARAETFGVADKLKAGADKIVLNKVGCGEKFKNFEGFISPDEIDVKVEYLGKPATLKLKRMQIVSRTLGQKAPAGAIVLFDGRNLDEFKGISRGKEVPANWVVNSDGSMTVNQERDAKGKKKAYVDLHTKREFGKLKMHLEFKFPPEYNKVRQGRNNSGVIFGGMYELQILDSFGFEGAWDECGSVYRHVHPMVHACLASGVWQTYDIEFTPAVYDGDKLVSAPKATAWVNGVLVQKDTPFVYPTHLQPADGAKFDQKKHLTQVFIKLQDHTDPISFRNIWVLPR